MAPVVETHTKIAPTAGSRGEDVPVEARLRREEVPEAKGPRRQEVLVAAEPVAEEAILRAQGGASLATSRPAIDAMATLVSAAVAQPEGILLRELIMNSARSAKRLLGRVCLPQFQEELCRYRAMDVFNDLYVAMLRMVNSVFVVRDASLRATDNICLTLREVATARVRAEKAEEELESTRAREAARAEELQVAKDENCEWEARFQEVERKGTGEFEWAWVAEEKLGDAVVRLENFEYQLRVASLKADEADEQAANIEAAARVVKERYVGVEADAQAAWERAVRAKATAQAAERRAAEVEARAQTAEARVAKAMGHF